MARVYSSDEKATALNLYVSQGLAEAWRITGIPKPTIASWARRAGLPHTDAASKTRAATLSAAARADQLRAELRLNLLEKAVDLLQRMDAPHVEFKGKDSTEVTYPIAPAGAVQNYATSVGILVDKYRLEVGEATGRLESRELNDKPDDELRDAIRRAEAILAGDPVGTTPPAEGKAEG
jgi:transposase-like protein